VLYTKQILQS